MTGRGRPRPFRAIAYTPDWTSPNGRRRVVAGRTAAVTRAGLDRWIRAHEAKGNVVDVIVVDALDLESDQVTNK